MVPSVLAAYDNSRGRVGRLPAGAEATVDGPVVRITGFAGGGFVGYRDLGGLHGDELDALIARQVAVFAERGERFEWKLHAHDQPADLADHLLAAGFVPEETETVVIAPVAAVAGSPRLPDGVTLRELTERADFERIAEMEAAVWGDPESHGWLADMLESERAVDPGALAVFGAEADGLMVCAAWIRFEGNTPFATLWGGGTLPEWRGRGIYRATVAHRARLAQERGYDYLQVDASDDSRPILERLGFEAVTTTTPYVWSPLVALLRAHVERFNAGVQSGDWQPMLAAFARDAELVFEGVPAGPFAGRDAIAAAYAEQPPDDQVVLLGPPSVERGTVASDYAWKRAGTRAGRMLLTARDGAITRLVVTFG
jgi:GNAT superfamily N-acetyltransferase